MKAPHRARRLALQTLCCLDVQGIDAMDGVMAFLADSMESPKIIAAAEHFLRETCARRDEIDAILREYARHWELKRLALVDRNILRMAVCEMQSQAAGAKIVISEAIRLAEEFSTAESPRFVNGILDAIYKGLCKNTE